MDSLTVLLIAVGLAMDAFAVSVARGMRVENQRRKYALVLASSFAVFQMFMPVLGWLAGLGLEELVMGIDHWIAFGLLALIGSKMIYESTKKDAPQKENDLRLHTLLALSVATSIDALVVGLSMALTQTAILTPIVVIGVVTFSLSCVGFMFGSTIGSFVGKKMEAVGGIVLIAIGAKILLEHMVL